MKKLFNLLVLGFCTLVVAGLVACSEHVAGGSVTDPNALADNSSSSVAPGAPEDVGGDPVVRPPSIDIGDSSEPSGGMSDSATDIVFPPDTIVDLSDSCHNSLGESLCPSDLLDGDGETFYESAHCLVKVEEKMPDYFRVGVLFTNGKEFIQMEESVWNDMEEYSKTLGMHLAEERWGLCGELLDEFESYALPRLDSLEIWGVSGGRYVWDRNGCDNGTVNRMWSQSSLPVGIEDRIRERAEQYKDICIRWESAI